MLNQATQQVNRVFSTGEDIIPNENNNISTDRRFSAEKKRFQDYENELNPMGQRAGYDRPLGTSVGGVLTNSTNIGYAQTPIGHGTHAVTPTSPVKMKDIKEIERHLPSTSTFGTNVVPIHDPVIQATSKVPITGTGIPVTQSQYTTVQRPVEQSISEIRHDEFNAMNISSRQHESPKELSRWEAQQADVSSMRYENHQVFENWESNRSSFVTDRLNVMDDLLAGCDKKLEWLDQGVHKVIQFFKEREIQEERYSKSGKSHLPQLGEHFEKVDDPVLFGNFSRGMKENDAFHAQDIRNSEILGNFIKKDILDWILIPSENNYKNSSKTLKTPLREFRRKLDLTASTRNRSYQKYFKNYDTLQKSTKLTPQEDQIFKRQLKYSLSAREELRLLKLYNEQGLLVIHEYTRLATIRMNELQRAFSLYLQKYLELYSNSAITPEPILELIEGANGAEAVQSLFLPKNLLTYNNHEFLRRQLNRPEITYNDITNYLVNFPDSIDPARSAFITREWEAVKVGGFFHRTRPCIILTTNTNNLLIVEKKLEDSENGKVKDPFQLRFTSVNKVYASNDGSGTVVSIIERTPGSVFHHNAKAKLKFETPEEAQSFLDFLQSKAGIAFDQNNAIAGNFVNSQMMTQSQVNNLNTSYGGQLQGSHVTDPYARSLGSQVQAGQIINSHTIGERAIINEQPIIGRSQAIYTTTQPVTQTIYTQQPHIIKETIISSEPITAQTVIRDPQVLRTEPIGTMGRESTQYASTNIQQMSQQMTGDV